MLNHSPRRMATAALVCLGFAASALAVTPAMAETHNQGAVARVNLGPSGKVQAHRQAFLVKGETLGSNQLIQSENKLFGFWLKPSGAVAVIKWTSATTAKELWNSGHDKVAKVVFDDKAIVRLLDAEEHPVGQLGQTEAAATVKAEFRITNDGDVVINHDGKQVWKLDKNNAPTQPEPEDKNVLRPGSSLNAGYGILSNNGRYVVSVSKQGNVFVYDRVEKATTWESGTEGKAQDARLIVNVDGNVTLVTGDNSVLWQTGTAKAGVKNPRLVLRDSGALEVMHEGVQVWSSVSDENDPGAVMTPDMSLSPGESLVSRNGKFSLILTKDGTLLISKVGTPDTAWKADTKGAKAVKLSLSAKGNLQLLGEAGAVVWESATSAEGIKDPRVVLRNTGVLQVMHGAKAVWTSQPA